LYSSNFDNDFLSKLKVFETIEHTSAETSAATLVVPPGE